MIPDAANEETNPSNYYMAMEVAPIDIAQYRSSNSSDETAPNCTRSPSR